jgi:hypothetical protein
MMRLLWRSINHFERNFGALEPLHSVLEADVAVFHRFGDVSRQ